MSPSVGDMIKLNSCRLIQYLGRLADNLFEASYNLPINQHCQSTSACSTVLASVEQFSNLPVNIFFTSQLFFKYLVENGYEKLKNESYESCYVTL